MDDLKEQIKELVYNFLERGNPYHDKFGKFASKGGGSSKIINKYGKKVKLGKHLAGKDTPVVSLSQKKFAGKVEIHVASLIGKHVKIHGNNKPVDLEGLKYIWEVKCILPTNKNYKATLTKKKVKRKLKEAKKLNKKIGLVIVDFKAKGLKSPVYWYSTELKSPRLDAKTHENYLTKVGNESAFKKFIKKKGLK